MRMVLLLTVRLTRSQSSLRQSGVFLFNVTNAEGKKQEFLVDMRKTGSFYLGKTVPGQKVKPDVTVSVSDKDMVSLSTGKMNVSRT